MNMLAALRRGYHRGRHPRRVLTPAPYIAPDEFGDVHIHLTGDGVMPAFRTDPFVRKIVLHGPIQTFRETW